MADRPLSQLEQSAPAENVAGMGPAIPSLLGSAAAGEPQGRGFQGGFHRNQMWSYFGPAFVASVAYIDPGNFAANIAGEKFSYTALSAD